MQAPVIEKRFHDSNPVAKLNREVLQKAKVLAISIAGVPGCGKTALIDATARRLMPDVHVGVIACDASSHRDADLLRRDTAQVVQVNTGAHSRVDATYIRDALQWLDLDWVQLLLIEKLGTLVGPHDADLGEDKQVAMFCAAGGHQMPEKHPEFVDAVEAVVLGKTDLLPSVPFDLVEFRTSLKRLNPNALLFEVSALHGDGMDEWINWLKSQLGDGRLAE